MSVHRDMLGHLTQTATWVICSKCGTGFIGDDTLSTCSKCIRKYRSFVSKNSFDAWDYIAISIIPALGTLFLILSEINMHMPY